MSMDMQDYRDTWIISKFCKVWNRDHSWKISHLNIYSMTPNSRQRILNVMGTFRPAFRHVAQSLTDIDLILVEEAFERLLLVSTAELYGNFSIVIILWANSPHFSRTMIAYSALWVYRHVYGVELVRFIRAIKSLPLWSECLSSNSERAIFVYMKWWQKSRQ